MFVAMVSTRHFEFIGLDHTREGVKSAMLARWEKHCKQWPEADPGYMQELIDGGDVQIAELEPGTAINFGPEG